MSRRLNVQNREVTCIDPPRQTKAVRNRKHGIINAEQKDCEKETQEKTQKATRRSSEGNYLES